jgi:polyhydroxyalkanoate synthesis regulator phasin
MANGSGLNLSWWHIIVLIMAIGGGFLSANAQQKSNTEDLVKEIKIEQKEKHDKIDEKFETVTYELQTINIRLERVVTLLEERTHE